MSTVKKHTGILPMTDFGRMDAWLLINTLLLVSLSIVMVYSATIVTDAQSYASGIGRAGKHAIYVAVGLLGMTVIAHIPMSFWQRFARHFMVFGVLLLALILIPGIGYEVNGSTRWLVLGPLRIQPSEFMKLFMIIYMADYLTRRRAQLKSFKLGVLNIAVVVGIVGGLLLLEPDLGTTIVIASTVFAMMYVSGVRYSHMLLCVIVAGTAFVLLAVLSPYRLERVMSFQNPWADPWDSGFQLSQALIAFGRGEWFGMGLGQSIQKLFYLPHAANDFLAAVIAEELGFAGMLVLISMYVAFLWRGFSIAAKAEKSGHDFAARSAHGVIILISLQAIVNLGVNMGVLPTKGITLPLMSYGGSSIIVTLALVGLVFAVDRELRTPAGSRRK
jgi:cell division protein FtsW